MKKTPILSLGHGCNCEYCRKYHLEKYKDIMKCKCFCHQADVAFGHSNLCCPYPNIKRHFIKKPAKNGKI